MSLARVSRAVLRATGAGAGENARYSVTTYSKEAQQSSPNSAS